MLDIKQIANKLDKRRLQSTVPVINSFIQKFSILDISGYEFIHILSILIKSTLDEDPSLIKDFNIIMEVNQEKPISKWVSIKDRLPTSVSYYTVTNVDKSRLEDIVISGASFERSELFTGEFDGSNFISYTSNDKPITYWFDETIKI